MGAEEVQAFLFYLVIHAQVTASAWNVALHALLFLYRYVGHKSIKMTMIHTHVPQRGDQEVRSPLDGR
jgi:hypothetical protein